MSDHVAGSLRAGSNRKISHENQTTEIKALWEAVSVLAQYNGFFGQYIDISIPGNNPKNLPKAIEYNGRVYGLSGHNTDLGKAAYATGKIVAYRK